MLAASATRTMLLIDRALADVPARGLPKRPPASPSPAGSPLRATPAPGLGASPMSDPRTPIDPPADRGPSAPGALDPRETITRLLSEIPQRPQAAGELLPLVYEELRALARARMRGERDDHTLRATALVHEAYMRIAGIDAEHWKDRAHFFRAAAEAMRRVLIDHARAKAAVKRGGGARPARIDAVEIGMDSDPVQVLALDEALETLRHEDERAAEVVRLRFFAGLGFPEIATVLDCSERTIMREWAFARARLVQLLECPDPGDHA